MKNVSRGDSTILKFILECALVVFVVARLDIAAAHSIASTNQMDFTVNRHSIRLGESAELSWNIIGSEKGFLSYIGAVKNIGMMTVHPEHTTTYALLADTTSGLIANNITVSVIDGRRGDEFSLSEDNFKYPLSDTTKVGFADLAAQIHSVLQDQMHLSVKKVEYDPDHVRLVFMTSLAHDNSLLKPSEPKIGARRVAYLVTIERGAQDGSLDYTVKTLVEYRLKIEETWRPEQSDDLYTLSGNIVRNRIGIELKSQHSSN